MERLVDSVTPLGDAMWFRQMTGVEAISSLFEFDVTFHSLQTSLSAKAMLGKDVTLKIETENNGAPRIPMASAPALPVRDVRANTFCSAPSCGRGFGLRVGAATARFFRR